eukprot:scaffold3334_cov369-Prasinococcus_capsulatus_cf.AAC.2
MDIHTEWTHRTAGAPVIGCRWHTRAHADAHTSRAPSGGPWRSSQTPPRAPGEQSPGSRSGCLPGTAARAQAQRPSLGRRQEHATPGQTHHFSANYVAGAEAVVEHDAIDLRSAHVLLPDDALEGLPARAPADRQDFGHGLARRQLDHLR